MAGVEFGHGEFYGEGVDLENVGSKQVLGNEVLRREEILEDERREDDLDLAVHHPVQLNHALDVIGRLVC